MKRRHIWLGIGMAIISAGSAGWLWHMRRESTAIWATLASLEQKQAKLKREIVEAEQRRQGALAEAEKMRVASAGAAKNAVTQSKDSARPLKKPDGSAFSLDDFLRQGATPEKRAEATERWLVARRASLPLRYAWLYRRLNLVAETREAFARNVMQAEERQQDLNEAALAQGYRTTDDAIGKFRREINASYESAQSSLLGSVGYQALVDFERTSEFRDTTSRIAGVAMVMGEPLSTGQAERLVRSMAEARSDPGGNPPGPVDWARVKAQLPSYLSETQVKILLTTEPPQGGLAFAEWQARLDQVRKNETEKRAASLSGAP